MNRFHLLAAFALCWATCAAATTIVPCPSGLPGYLDVTPSPADSAQAIQIIAGRFSYVPKAVSIEVHDNTIDVILTAEAFDVTPPPPMCTSSVIGPLPSGVYTVNLRLDSVGFPQFGLIFLTSTTLEVSGPPDALSGLWWNPSESGWGINFTQRGSVVFAVWYTYDSAGFPKWYVAPHCELPRAADSGRCVETLYEVSGPTFFGTHFDPAAKHVNAVGTLTMEFTNANAASMTSTINGLERTTAVVRQPLRSGTTPPPVNYTDLWWNPDESGWGMAITHQYDVMFLAWFVYDNAGRPMWYVASNCNASQEGCAGTLYRTTGPVSGATFDPAQVQVFPVGTVSVEFLDSNSGVLTYTVDGLSSTKNIKRQIF